MQNLLKKIIRIAIGLLCLVSPFSLACTCADPGRDSEDAVIEAFCSVDVVFIGTVTEANIVNNERVESKIEPLRSFKGDLVRSVVAAYYSTCDQPFPQNVEYLIFGMIDKDTKRLLTSICGPTRFTRQLKHAEFQRRIVEDNISRFDELCSEPAKKNRRLRMLKERRDLSGVEFDQLVEDTRAIQNNGE